MQRNLFFLLGVIVVVLAGCSLAPKYTQPEAPVPAGWPTGAAYKDTGDTSGAAIAAELGWQEFFTDERLKKIIAAALQNNRDLRLAALNVQKARALYGIQRAELLPAVDATAGYSKQLVPTSTYGSLASGLSSKSITMTQYDINLGISSWEIDFFGLIRSLKDEALEEYLATDQARISAQISLVSSLAEAYLTLAADRESLKIAQSTLKSQQATYDLIKKRNQVGIANELDLSRAQTQVDTAIGDVARFTQLAAQDENALNLLAGSTLPDELLPSDLSSLKTPQEISAGISSEVLLRRPDVLQAEHMLKAAYADIGAARAAFFPRISLTAAAGIASGDLSGLFKYGSDAWSYAPQIVMPIFDARIWPALRASNVERESALAQYEKAIQTAFREVADALAVQGTVGRRLSAQESLLNASAETYRLSDVRYSRGIDNYLGVLDAQRSLYAARQGLIAVRLDKLTNQVRLYNVLGGGAKE